VTITKTGEVQQPSQIWHNCLKNWLVKQKMKVVVLVIVVVRDKILVHISIGWTASPMKKTCSNPKDSSRGPIVTWTNSVKVCC